MNDLFTVPRHPVGRPRTAVGLLLAAAVVVGCASGCERGLDTSYAAVRGNSINGVSAFVQLLRDTGHATTARQQLPRSIDPEYRTIVVFDDSFSRLDPEAAMVLLEACVADEARTLLLVLRDSDAMIGYLRDILARDDLPTDRRRAAESMLASAERSLSADTAQPREETSFLSDGLAPTVRPAGSVATVVQVLDDGRDDEPVTARWQLRRRLCAATTAVTLWQVGDERLLVQENMETTRVLVLVSAAPLLNGGLVDPGNRALAEHLVGLLPVDGRLLLAGSARVASGGGDDAAGDEPSPWRLLFVQPLPWIAAQAFVVLGLFCWQTAPIFGRPRRIAPEQAQDFGHHVDALAHLLSRAGVAGAAFSWRRLQEWRQAPPTGPRKRPRRRGTTPSPPSP